ncbi:MAG TPA: NADPH:quinone oxidoreductase family protein [Myxococcota bacterium]|nr:NADPH:quinone oxidoreductase family protein [Myxococcota bacterium]
MRAWQVVRHGTPAQALALNDVAPPEPGPGFLRVRVAAAALGLPDVLMCRGAYALTPRLPFTPGQELSGVVEAAGAGARTPVGARVMAVSGFFLGHGSFAEEALALDDFCFPVPAPLADAEAASFLIPYHTAYVGLVRRAALQAGESLLVLGAAGGTGSAALQLGRALGARVIAAARGAERSAFCREQGADAVVDPQREPLAERVRELTNGRGADVVYDPVGGEAFEAATRAVAHEGRLLAVGFASGRWGQVDTAHLVTRNYSVMGVIPSAYDRAFKAEAQARLEAWLRDGRLRVPLSRTVPFAELPAGLEALAAGGMTGRLALSVAA